MDQIRVTGRTDFYFKLKDGMIDKLRKGRDVFTDSANTQTVYTNQLEIPVNKLMMKDKDTVLIPPMELVIRGRITIKRDKSKGRPGRRKR